MMIPAALLVVAALAAAQLGPRMESLVAAVRPALPFPAATPGGDLPDDNSAASRWFVVWPAEQDDTRIIVRGNPLHPDVQKASVEAMEAINAAVAAAERRAQASYDRALEQLRKTGRAADLDTVTLDDEGAAGERIDAELEVTISLEPAAAFEIATGEAPVVRAGTSGVSWMVSVAPNTYRPTTGDDRREHYRAAETHLYFGLSTRPAITRRGNEPAYRVEIAPSPGSFAVAVRGNAALVGAIARGADWARLGSR